VLKQEYSCWETGENAEITEGGSSGDDGDDNGDVINGDVNGDVNNLQEILQEILKTDFAFFSHTYFSFQKVYYLILKLIFFISKSMGKSEMKSCEL
jgi:hypothetical protein